MTYLGTRPPTVDEFVIWSSRDGYEEYREDAGYYFYFQETGKVPKRLLAIAEVILIIAPPVDEAYLTYVLERLRQLGPFPKSEELDSLLPWAEELPEEIETKTKPKK